MGAYASVKDAKETIGAHTRLTCEIILLDPAGNRPSATFWTNPRTLYLCSGEPFLRDSTASTGFKFYESLVKDWGPISQSCNIGELGSAADLQIVLHNKKLIAQSDNSAYTFGAGTPAAVPCPRGDEVRLSEIFNFYTILGSVVTIKILWFAEASTDQSVAANFKSDTMYKGIVHECRLEGEEIILDIVQDQSVLDTTLPGRLLKLSPVKELRTQRAPIVYGDFNTWYSYSYTHDFMNGLARNVAIRAGLLKPALCPLLPWKADYTAPYAGAGVQNSKIYNYYIYNDTKGTTNQWEYQEGITGKGSNDAAYLYHSECDVFGSVDEGNPGSTTPGQTVWPYMSSTSYEQYVQNHDHIRGWAYIPCDSIYQTSSTSAITNGEKMFDGDPYTYAELPLDAANWVKLRIRNVPPLGNVILEADCIRAYVVLETSAATTGTKVRFGVYRQAVPTAGENYLGVDEPDAPGLATYGEITAASSTFTKGMYDQHDYNADAIPYTSYVQESGTQEPISRWEWKHTFNQRGVGDVVVAIESYTPFGAAGQTLKIIAAGILVKYSPKAESTTKTSVNRRIISNVGRFYQSDPTGGALTSSSPFQKIVGNPLPIWISPSTTMRDRDVDLGTSSYAMTQVLNEKITWAAYIPSHLLLKFGSGLTWVDQKDPVNYSRASASDPDAFGSCYWALVETAFAPNYSNEATGQLIISNETSMRDVLARYVSQWPFGMYRDVANGRYLTIVYPADHPSAYLYQDFTTYTMELHPNIDHPDAEHYGKPYVVTNVNVRMSPTEELFNRFRIKYHYCMASDTLTYQQVVTETPNDCSVMSLTFPITLDGTTSALAAATNMAWDASSVCATSQARYGVKRWFPTVEAPSIHRHEDATGFLNYLIRRYTQTRIIIDATLGTEGYDIRPGHIVKFSRDMNLVYPYMDYAHQGAKLTGWDHSNSALTDPNNVYLVTSTSKQPYDTGVYTTFSCEQIMFTCTGAYWDPAVDGLSPALNLRAQDITGLVNADPVATWQKHVGNNATQATAAYKPIYYTNLQNGRPGVYFDGTNDCMVISWAASGVNSVALHFVVNLELGGSVDRCLLSHRKDGSNYAYYYENETTTSNKMAVNNSGTMRNSTAVGTTGAQVLSFIGSTAGGLLVYRNGVQVGATASFTEADIATTVGAYLGALYDGASAYMKGYLFEVGVCYGAANIADSERQKWEGYLAHGWGLEADLPTTHPYRYSPPVVG